LNVINAINIQNANHIVITKPSNTNVIPAPITITQPSTISITNPSTQNTQKITPQSTGYLVYTKVPVNSIQDINRINALNAHSIPPIIQIPHTSQTTRVIAGPNNHKNGQINITNSTPSKTTVNNRPNTQTHSLNTINKQTSTTTSTTPVQSQISTTKSIKEDDISLITEKLTDTNNKNNPKQTSVISEAEAQWIRAEVSNIGVQLNDPTRVMESLIFKAAALFTSSLIKETLAVYNTQKVSDPKKENQYKMVVPLHTMAAIKENKTFSFLTDWEELLNNV